MLISEEKTSRLFLIQVYGVTSLVPVSALLPSFSHTDKGWEIDKEELTLGKELDSGQFGVSTSVVLYTCTNGRTVTSLHSHVPCTHES